MIDAFTGFAEFRKTYGARDDPGFVDLLYANVLDRAPEPEGLTEWLARLDFGWSRADLVAGVSQSREFIRDTGAPLAAWMRGQGPDDTLEGGAGENLLMGGSCPIASCSGPARRGATSPPTWNLGTCCALRGSGTPRPKKR